MFLFNNIYSLVIRELNQNDKNHKVCTFILINSHITDAVYRKPDFVIFFHTHTLLLFLFIITFAILLMFYLTLLYTSICFTRKTQTPYSCFTKLPAIVALSPLITMTFILLLHWSYTSFILISFKLTLI